MSMSRRQFFKSSAGTIAAVAIADMVLPPPAAAAWPPTGMQITDKWKDLLAGFTEGTGGLHKWSNNLRDITFDDILWHHGFDSPNGPNPECEGRINKLDKVDFDDLAKACAKKFGWKYPDSRAPGSCSCTT